MIMYGSQTGTAEEYARRLARDFKQKFGQPCIVADPDDHELETLHEIPSDKIVVLIVSCVHVVNGCSTDYARRLLHMARESPRRIPLVYLTSFAHTLRTQTQRNWRICGMRYSVWATVPTSIFALLGETWTNLCRAPQRSGSGVEGKVMRTKVLKTTLSLGKDLRWT